MQADEGLRLLTEEERRQVELGTDLPAVGFVENFERWAARKTDAPPYTLRAAGLMALSLAAGDGVVLQGPVQQQAHPHEPVRDHCGTHPRCCASPRCWATSLT